MQAAKAIMAIMGSMASWATSPPKVNPSLKMRTAADGVHNYMALNRPKKCGKLKPSLHRKN